MEVLGSSWSRTVRTTRGSELPRDLRTCHFYSLHNRPQNNESGRKYISDLSTRTFHKNFLYICFPHFLYYALYQQNQQRRETNLFFQPDGNCRNPLHLARGQDLKACINMTRNKDKTRLRFFNHQHCFNHKHFSHG